MGQDTYLPCWCPYVWRLAKVTCINQMMTCHHLLQGGPGTIHELSVLSASGSSSQLNNILSPSDARFLLQILRFNLSTHVIGRCASRHHNTRPQVKSALFFLGGGSCGAIVFIRKNCVLLEQSAPRNFGPVVWNKSQLGQGRDHALTFAHFHSLIPAFRLNFEVRFRTGYVCPTLFFETRYFW